MSTVQVSDDLHERLERQADLHGESVERLVEEILKHYMQVMEAQPTTLAEQLLAARAKIEASGIPLISSWEELEREKIERRGGYYEETP